MPTGKYIRSEEQIKHHKEIMQSPEHRKKISKLVNELYMKKPEIKIKISESVKKRYREDPGYRLLVSERTKEAMKRPDVRARYIAGTEKRREEQRLPENRKKESEHFKKVWRNKENREKMINALHNRKISDGRRKIMAESMKKRWENPEYKKKQREIMKKRWESKKYQELIKKRRHSHPNFFETNFHNVFSELKYIGDYSFFVGRKNPDFILDGTKKCIDLFGDSFHELSEVEARKEYFLERGFELIIIWESEWRYERDKTMEKVKEFIVKEGKII